jgi:hypothetical protein
MGAFLTAGDAGAEAILRRPRGDFVADSRELPIRLCFLGLPRLADDAGGASSLGVGASLKVAFSGSDMDFNLTAKEGVESALSAC